MCVCVCVCVCESVVCVKVLCVTASVQLQNYLSHTDYLNDHISPHINIRLLKKKSGQQAFLRKYCSFEPNKTCLLLWYNWDKPKKLL